MAFLDQEISFDMGHLLLLVALVVFIIFVAGKCRLSCGGNSENLAVQPVHWKSCRCPDCVKACYQKAKDGYLYGCSDKNPYVPFGADECDYQYRKCALHGCGVA